MSKRTPTPWKSAIMLKDRAFYDDTNIPIGYCNETGEDLREQLRVGQAIVVANAYQGLPNHQGEYPKAEANARHIVHCVNLHDKLLAALRTVVDMEYDRDEESRNFDEERLQYFASLIAQAEGRPA